MHFRAMKTVDEESCPPQFVYATTVVSLCLVGACIYNDGFLSLSKMLSLKKLRDHNFQSTTSIFVQHKIILKYSRVHLYSLTPYEGCNRLIARWVDNISCKFHQHVLYLICLLKWLNGNQY